MKKQGYLLIDVAVGASIIVIFSVTILSIFQSYINIKKKSSSSKLNYFIIKELDENLDYNSLKLLDEGIHCINIKSIEEIKDKNIIEFITEEDHDKTNKLFIKEKNEFYVEYEFLTYENNKNIGFIKYRRS